MMGWEINLASIFISIVITLAGPVMIVVVCILIKIIIWDNLKKLFKKKQHKEILEKNPFEEKSNDN